MKLDSVRLTRVKLQKASLNEIRGGTGNIIPLPVPIQPSIFIPVPIPVQPGQSDSNEE